MPRDLTGDMEAALLARVKTVILLAELQFEGGTDRAWTGIGPLAWAGETWHGTGLRGTVSPVEESTDLVATQVTFGLSGVPAEFIALLLGDQYHGRPARLWLACLDAAGQIIPDPTPIWDGRMDAPQIVEGGETSDVTIVTVSRFADFERPKVRRRTDEDQQELHPGDSFFRHQAALAEKRIVWGQAG